jgi:hypothetical protein
LAIYSQKAVKKIKSAKIMHLLRFSIAIIRPKSKKNLEISRHDKPSCGQKKTIMHHHSCRARKLVQMKGRKRNKIQLRFPR